jgi:hypothetical protein
MGSSPPLPAGFVSVPQHGHGGMYHPQAMYGASPPYGNSPPYCGSPTGARLGGLGGSLRCVERASAAAPGRRNAAAGSRCERRPATAPPWWLTAARLPRSLCCCRHAEPSQPDDVCPPGAHDARRRRVRPPAPRLQSASLRLKSARLWKQPAGLWQQPAGRTDAAPEQHEPGWRRRRRRRPAPAGRVARQRAHR